MKSILKFTASVPRLFSMFVVILASIVLGMSCTDDASDERGILSISDVVLEKQINTAIGDQVTVSGKGFKSGDAIMLRSTTVNPMEYTATTPQATSSSITFIVPKGVTNGEYKVFLVRNGQLRLLGRTTLALLSDVPDKEGMNVKGVIRCDDKPVADVVVSDGILVTKSDANGIFYLNSEKKNGYVFISVPRGYEAGVVSTVPQFFGYLNQGASVVEQCDFTLTRCDNDHHRVVVFTDVHLANRVSDRSQFQSGFLREMTVYLQQCKTDNMPVYGVALGDLSWDSYWYENNYDLADYLKDMQSLSCAIYSAPGNHDNDPKIANDDFSAATPFRKIIGPTYFSFNLGAVHYILLDNVVYDNPDGITGSHTYATRVSEEQLAWLKADLATVEKATPIVLGMHVPLYKAPTLDGAGQTQTAYNMEQAEAFVACLDGYNVNVITGHTHYNFSVTSKPSLREHNINAVCATWWWTGHTDYAGNHISRDGSPGGYKIFEMDNTSISWQFKSIGKDAGYQFRTYDLNRCLLTQADLCPNASAAEFNTYARGYNKVNTSNEVLINVFDWADDWQIQVTDLSDNSTLTPTRTRTYDPLHVLSYNMRKLAKASALTFDTSYTAHMFKVTAKTATSQLKVVVTDGFGNKYEQTMARPKALAFGME